jgi:hypothetical protein
MVRYFVVAFIIIFFSSCGSSALITLNKDKTYITKLSYTKKGEIKNYFDTIAIFRATYLNKIDSSYKNDTFFIGLYISDDFEDESKKGLNNKNFKLYLDGKEPISIKSVGKDSEIFKSMPNTDRWSNYYIVEFLPTKNKTITLLHIPTKQKIEFRF